MSKKTAIGIGIGVLAIALGAYLLTLSGAPSETPEIRETSEATKNEHATAQLNSVDSGNPIKVIYSNFSILYKISNAKLLSITEDSLPKMLLLSIKTVGAGNVTLEIPRALIDAKFGAHDDKFLVLTDGKEIDYEESKTNIARSLNISFPDGTQQIQIKEPVLPNRTHVSGTNFSVSYNITNGQVVGVKADISSQSLIVSIQPTGDGVLTITIPRGLIDAGIQTQDDKFFVLNDGQENTDYKELNPTQTYRTLSIPFKQGNQEIEIIGTDY